jgi:hypothetical protein
MLLLNADLKVSLPPSLFIFDSKISTLMGRYLAGSANKFSNTVLSLIVLKIEMVVRAASKY